MRQVTLPVRAIDSISAASGVVFFAITAANVVSPTTWLSTATNCPVWADLAAMWDEYRIESVRIHAVPVNRYAGTSDDAYIIGLDADGVIGASVTSLGQAISYPSSRVVSAADPFELTWVIPQGAKNIWYDVNGTSGVNPALAPPLELFVAGGVAPWSGIFTSTGAVHRLAIEMMISFRGIRQ
jgi:hypothetical protein